jgi:hypothetical protein
MLGQSAVESNTGGICTPAAAAAAAAAVSGTGCLELPHGT